MMKYLILALLLTGCSLKKGNYPEPKAYSVHIINKQACASEWEEAKEYFLSIGIRIVEDTKAPYRYVCVHNPLGLMRKVLCPIDVVGLTTYGGQDTETAWSFNSTKTIVHELAHLIFKLPHGSGIMFPDDLGTQLSRGFSEKQLEALSKK
jgi:hypothetical protein